MNKHDGDERQFIWLSKAWYAKANIRLKEELDEFTLGFYCHDGGTSGEFVIRWVSLGNGKYAARLEAFEDAWSALLGFQDLLNKLKELDNTDPTPEKFYHILINLGIKDNTPYQSPYKS